MLIEKQQALAGLDPNIVGGAEITAGFDESLLPEQNPKKLKAKRYKGMLEWILDRDGHEFLVAVDRSFIRDESNLVGLAEKMADDLNMPKEILVN